MDPQLSGLRACLSLLAAVVVPLVGSIELGLFVSLLEPQFTVLSRCLEKGYDEGEAQGRIYFTTF